MPRMLIARISVGAAFVFTTIGCGSGGSTAANNGNSAGRDAGVGGDAGSSGGVRAKEAQRTVRVATPAQSRPVAQELPIVTTDPSLSL